MLWWFVKSGQIIMWNMNILYYVWRTMTPQELQILKILCWKPAKSHTCTRTIAVPYFKIHVIPFIAHRLKPLKGFVWQQSHALSSMSNKLLKYYYLRYALREKRTPLTRYYFTLIHHEIAHKITHPNKCDVPVKRTHPTRPAAHTSTFDPYLSTDITQLVIRHTSRWS